MTQPNTFIQEIDEDFERQKMEALWKRYGGWVITFALAIVIVTAGTVTYNSWQSGKQQKATDELSAILNNPDTDTNKQIEILTTFAAKNHGETQSTFALLHAASLASANSDAKKAVALYDQVANDNKADPAFRQLADLYSVQTQMDSSDPAVLEKRLQPLLADNAPFRYTAMEDAGYLALKAGNKEKAKQIFTELSQNADAPPSLIARAGDMVRFLAN